MPSLGPRLFGGACRRNRAVSTCCFCSIRVSLSSQGVGGLRTDEARALFDKYDADGSGHLSYNEFADALLTHR